MRCSLGFEASGGGMLTVETIGRIRREHFLKGKTIKEIVRDLKVSRNTVRKVLRSGATSFEYERNVQPRRKLGRWTAVLEELLTGNAAKPIRERLTLIRIFEELRGRGYDGGYDAVRRYARRWSKERGQSTAAAYVPLSFAPGEAYQFDWSHEVVLLSGVTVIVKVAHVRLCHSRMPIPAIHRPAPPTSGTRFGGFGLPRSQLHPIVAETLSQGASKWRRMCSEENRQLASLAAVRAL